MSDSLLAKLNLLPQDIKDNLSLPDVLRSLEELEAVYEIKPTKYLVSLLLNEITPEQIGSTIAADYGNLNQIQLHNVSMIFAELLTRIKGVPAKKEAAQEKSNTNLVMSTSDESEVKSMPSYNDEKINTNEYERNAVSIMEAFKFNQADAVMTKRLTNIIIARLRDVRDELETIENLTKSSKVGGMGFTPEQADELIKIIKHGLPITTVKPSIEAFKEIESLKSQEEKDSSKDQLNDFNKEIEKGKSEPLADNPAIAAAPMKSAAKEERPSAPVTPAKVQPVSAKPAPASAKQEVAMSLEDLQPTIVMEGGLPVIKMPNENVTQDTSSKAQGSSINPQKKQITPDSKLRTENQGKFQAIIKEDKNVSPPFQGGLRSKGQERSAIGGESRQMRPQGVFGADPGQGGGLPEIMKSVIDTPVLKSQTEQNGLPKGLDNGKILGTTKEKQISNIQYPISDDSKPIVDKKPESPAVNKEISNTKLPPPKPEPYITSAKIPEKVFNAPASRRPTLDDVKFIKKTVGPVDELMQMTLIEFRRLSPDPKEAVKKVKEKINLLDRESFNKRNEGIAAWYKNEINRFYRLLGQACMSEGKGIEAIIKERLLAGKPTLSLEEFDAVMELNKELRY